MTAPTTRPRREADALSHLCHARRGVSPDGPIAPSVCAVECEACGAANRSGAKFCLSCGTPLPTEPADRPAVPRSDPGPISDAAADTEADAAADAAATASSSGAADPNPWLASVSAPSGPPPAPVLPAPAQAVEPGVEPGPLGAGLPTDVATGAPTPTPPVPSAPVAPAPDDPHGFASAAKRLRQTSLQAGFPALAVASISLHDDEQVQVLVQGVIGGLWGVALLTDRRVLLVTPRLWTPDRITLDIEPGLTVKGWAEGPFASLTFDNGRAVHLVEQITDTILAVELANRLRAEVDKRTSS